MFCFGGLTLGSHLFPFRTEKLSLVVAMILVKGKVASRQNKVFNKHRVSLASDGVLYCLTFKTQ